MRQGMEVFYKAVVSMGSDETVRSLLALLSSDWLAWIIPVISAVEELLTIVRKGFPVSHFLLVAACLSCSILNLPGEFGIAVVLWQLSMEQTRKDKMNNTEA